MWKITTDGDEVLHQTNSHNHSEDDVQAKVEKVKHDYISEPKRRSHQFLASTTMY